MTQDKDCQFPEEAWQDFLGKYPVTGTQGVGLYDVLLGVAESYWSDELLVRIGLELHNTDEGWARFVTVLFLLPHELWNPRPGKPGFRGATYSKFFQPPFARPVLGSLNLQDHLQNPKHPLADYPAERDPDEVHPVVPVVDVAHELQQGRRESRSKV